MALRSPVRTYSYVVCFASLATVVISFGFGAYDLIGYMYPDLMIGAWEYDRFESNEAYLKDWRHNHEDSPDPSDAEITVMRENERTSTLRREARTRAQGLLPDTIAFILGGVVFAFHWRLARSSHANGRVA